VASGSQRGLSPYLLRGTGRSAALRLGAGERLLRVGYFPPDTWRRSIPRWSTTITTAADPSVRAGHEGQDLGAGGGFVGIRHSIFSRSPNRRGRAIRRPVRGRGLILGLPAPQGDFSNFNSPLRCLGGRIGSAVLPQLWRTPSLD